MANRDLRRIGRRVAEGGKLGHVFFGRIVERELPFVTKLQDAHRREALRHRCDAEHRVGISRDLRGDVAVPDRADVRELAVDDDAPHGAGDVIALGEFGE